jgi:type VI secretion system protein ImpL
MSRETMIRVGLVVAILVVVVLLAVVALILRAARSKVPMVPLASAAGAAAAGAAAAAISPAGIVESLGAPIAMRRSFMAAVRRLKELSPRAADRLRAPWVLAIGEVGAGTSSLVASLPLDRLGGAVGESTSPCVWHFFERGVVIDIEGSLVLDPATGRGADHAWGSLISLLQRYRPERPLDAVVLAIPAVDLVGPTRLTREVAAERAARIEARLTELQRGVGLRLPVYVVITKCDRIPGFTPFARSVPADKAQGMLGWSSPYAIDAAFSPAWVEEALATVLRGIQHAEFDALARREAVASAGDFLLLPPRMTAAAAPLRDFLQRVFRPTAWEQGASLRGIYFTGDPVRAEPVDAAPPAAPEGDAAAPAAPAAPAVPVAAFTGPLQRPFLAELFGEKIFAEQGVARPGPRVFPSRNRAVALMQVATLAFLLLGPVALWWGADGIRVGPWQLTLGVRQQAQELEQLLQTVDGTVRTMAAPGTQAVSVFPLLGAMANVSSSHLGSPFLPSSWLTPLQGQVQRAIQTSFQVVVLPELREGLVDRIGTLVGSEGPDSSRKAAAPAPAMSLPQYVIDLTELAKNVVRFNKMSATGGGETRDLADLVHYLYGEQVAPSFFENDLFYRRALEQAQAAPIDPDAQLQAMAIQRAGALTGQAYASLLARVSDMGASADSGDAEASDVDASRADVEAVVGLRAFLDPDGPVQHSLAAIQLPFIFGDRFPVAVGDSLGNYTDRLTGEISTRFADHAHTLGATRRTFDALLHQHFMEAPTGQAIPGSLTPGMELRWDDTRLDEAIALDSNYETFLRHGLDSLPDALRGTVRRLATVQLAAAMANAVASAAVMKPALASARMESSRDLRGRVTNFEQSAPRLSRLLDLFDGVGATDQVDSLDAVSTRQATGVLARLDTAFDLSHRFVLPSSAVSSWSGRAPFSAAVFGAGRGAFAEYLSAEQDAIRSMVTLARPVVAFLQARVDAGAPAPRSLRSWLELVDDVDRADRKPPGGPLATIDRDVAAEIDSLDERTCLSHAPRPGASDDVLSRRMDDLRATVWRRCADVALGVTRSAYVHLQQIFRTRIAGRFPFSSADAAADASPADVVDLMRAWDVVAASAPALLSAAGAGAPRLAASFADMAAVRKFFAPLVDSAAAARPPAFDYQVDFRTNRGREAGANQIAEWSADIGDHHTAIDMAPAARKGRWIAGDTVRVTLQWATGSAVQPLAIATPGATIDGTAVIVSEGGTWSLIRLLRAFESDVADPEGGESVSIAVRTARKASAADPTATARAFLRVRLFNPDTKAELVLPRFPQSLPALPGEGSR